MYHIQYLINQLNTNLFTDFFYTFIFYYDIITTKLLTLLSYSNMLSDLAEGFAVSLILLILIVSGSVISIKVQDSIKITGSRSKQINSYKVIFKFFK